MNNGFYIKNEKIQQKWINLIVNLMKIIIPHNGNTVYIIWRNNSKLLKLIFYFILTKNWEQKLTKHQLKQKIFGILQKQYKMNK